MKLPFGIEIKRDKKETNSSATLLSRLLHRWSYGRELATPLDFQSLLNAYRGWVYVCANRNATSVASVPLKLYVAKNSGKKIKGYPVKRIDRQQTDFLMGNAGLLQLPIVRKAVEIEEITEHPFLDLMHNVNGFMNAFTLWETTELFQELCGNSYWYIVESSVGGKQIPVEIWPIPPQNLKVIPDQEKFIFGYKYEKGMDAVVFDESQVIHFKFPNPTNYYYGKAPLAAVTDAYNIGQNMNTYENAVFSNMGQLEGAFETDDAISDVEFERIKTEIKNSFQGAKNAGKSPLLDKGIKFKSYGLSPREMSFLQGRKQIKEEICNAYGQSLALYDKDSNRANSESATYNYMKDAIRPRCMRIEEKLNEKLLPRYDKRLFVAFENCVPQDKEFRLKEQESHLKSGYSSINEERQQDGQEGVEWGDVPYMPTGMVPVGTSIEEVGKAVAKRVKELVR